MRVIQQIRLTHANAVLGGFGALAALRAFDLDSDEPPPKELEPYERLFLAILNDAIETLKRDPHDEQNKRSTAWPQAKRWLMSNNDGYIFGFAPICEHFHWAPTWVRKKIVQAVNQAREEKTHHAKPQRLSVRGQYRKVGAGKAVRA